MTNHPYEITLSTMANLLRSLVELTDQTPATTACRNQLVIAARDLIGVRYHLQPNAVDGFVADEFASHWLNQFRSIQRGAV